MAEEASDIAQLPSATRLLIFQDLVKQGHVAKDKVIDHPDVPLM